MSSDADVGAGAFCDWPGSEDVNDYNKDCRELGLTDGQGSHDREFRKSEYSQEREIVLEGSAPQFLKFDSHAFSKFVGNVTMEIRSCTVQSAPTALHPREAQST